MRAYVGYVFCIMILAVMLYSIIGVLYRAVIGAFIIMGFAPMLP